MLMYVVEADPKLMEIRGNLRGSGEANRSGRINILATDKIDRPQ
jgi:hypothetical protein